MFGHRVNLPHSCRGVGCDAVYCCGTIPAFQRSIVYDEDGGSMDLQNVGNPSQYHTASQPRRPRLEFSPPWKPEISHQVISSSKRRQHANRRRRIMWGTKSNWRRVCYDVLPARRYATSNHFVHFDHVLASQICFAFPSQLYTIAPNVLLALSLNILC